VLCRKELLNRDHKAKLRANEWANARYYEGRMDEIEDLLTGKTIDLMVDNLVEGGL
jgi:hypothetical protein